MMFSNKVFGQTFWGTWNHSNKGVASQKLKQKDRPIQAHIYIRIPSGALAAETAHCVGLPLSPQGASSYLLFSEAFS